MKQTRGRMRRGLVSAPLILVLLVAGLAPARAQGVGSRATPAQLEQAREYIRRSWRTLTRSNRDLAAAAADPKFKPTAGGRWPVYVSNKESLAEVESRLRARMSAEAFARTDLRRLPARPRASVNPPGTVDASFGGVEPGLLYLPRPYVVPGGRFNEMYGWDSYFIQTGLLRDGETELARDMVENFLYEIEHYGQILNANRTYYLTRSQPPFLTRMILAVYERRPDRAWLARTVPAVEKYYRYWTEGDHLTPQTGLSRYFDSGTGPAPEVLADERDSQGRTHYDRVKEFYRAHAVTDYHVERV